MPGGNPGGGGGFGGGVGGFGSGGNGGGPSIGGIGGGGAGFGGGIFSNAGTVTLVNDTFKGNAATEVPAATQAMAKAVPCSASMVPSRPPTPPSARTPPPPMAAIFSFSAPARTTPQRPSSSTTSSASPAQTTVPDIDSFTVLSGLADFTGSTNDLVSSNGSSGLATADFITGDPLLGSLANNGGPTGTMALLAGSPAILGGTTADYPGTSTTITTDQRGVARTLAPDIGAYAMRP